MKFKIITKDEQTTMFEGSKEEVIKQWNDFYMGNVGSLDHVIEDENDETYRFTYQSVREETYNDIEKINSWE
jgi:hypothetical protein